MQPWYKYGPLSKITSVIPFSLAFCAISSPIAVAEVTFDIDLRFELEAAPSFLRTSFCRVETDKSVLCWESSMI